MTYVRSRASERARRKSEPGRLAFPLPPQLAGGGGDRGSFPRSILHSTAASTCHKSAAAAFILFYLRRVASRGAKGRGCHRGRHAAQAGLQRDGPLIFFFPGSGRVWLASSPASGFTVCSPLRMARTSHWFFLQEITWHRN